MAKIKTMLFVALLGAAIVPASFADTLSIGNEPEGLSLPHRGMTMDQVRGKFGAANEELPAVGIPPITRWVYPDYTVYYEHQYVIHAVAHHPVGNMMHETQDMDKNGTDDSKDTDDGPYFLLN
jgi:hypothetical protein